MPPPLSPASTTRGVLSYPYKNPFPFFGKVYFFMLQWPLQVAFDRFFLSLIPPLFIPPVRLTRRYPFLQPVLFTFDLMWISSHFITALLPRCEMEAWVPMDRCASLARSNFPKKKPSNRRPLDFAAMIFPVRVIVEFLVPIFCLVHNRQICSFLKG